MKFIVNVLCLLVFYTILLFLFSKLGISSTGIKSFVDSLSGAGIIIVFLLMVLSIIIPIPSSSIILVSLLLYGSIIGLFIIFFGSLVGTMLDFLMVRKFARKYLQTKYPIIMATVNDMTSHFGFQVTLFLRIFPSITLDIASYIPAVTKMKFRNFFLATIMGLIPSSLVYYIIGIGFETELSRKAVLSLTIGLSLFLIIILLIQKFNQKIKVNELEK